MDRTPASDNGGVTGHVGFALAGLVCLMLAQLLTKRYGVPSAVLLVAVGVTYGLLPGPNISLDPTLVITLVLPPLLYSAALQASLLEIRANLRAVGSLSVGLVLATAFAVAGLLKLALPDLPFAGSGDHVRVSFANVDAGGIEALTQRLAGVVPRSLLRVAA